MIFIPRKLFIFFVLVSLVACGLGGGIAFYLFSPQTAYSSAELKLISEWFLYGAVVGILILSALLLRIFMVRIQVKHELERIHAMSSYISLSSQLKSKKLHELGPHLSALFKRVSQINERQALKMSSQNALINFLSANMKFPLIVTDMFGKIIALSREAEENLNLERTKLMGSNLESLVPNIFIQQIVQNLPSQKSYTKEKKEDQAFTVYPIYNREQEIAYLIFDLRTNSQLDYSAGTGPQPALNRETEKKQNALTGHWKTFGSLLERFLPKNKNSH